MSREIPSEIRQAVIEKVLSSVAFARAEQLRRLLRWLGERAIEGDVAPTEHEVARFALGKPDSFDPQADSLVRKEMSRLRAKLRQYYSIDGRGDSVRIHNYDGYRLAFECARPGLDSVTSVAAHPCLMVLPFQASPNAKEYAEIFVEELWIALAALQRIDLISPAAARTFASLRTGFRSEADFLVDGSVRLKNDSPLVTLWLVDGHTSRARRHYRFSGTEPETLAIQAAEMVSLDILNRRSLGAASEG
jgi:TolB-like protein